VSCFRMPCNPDDADFRAAPLSVEAYTLPCGAKKKPGNLAIPRRCWWRRRESNPRP